MLSYLPRTKTQKKKEQNKDASYAAEWQVIIVASCGAGTTNYNSSTDEVKQM
jgi:hypothetical protein